MEETYVCENCKMEINIKERVNHTLKCLGNFFNRRNNKSSRKYNQKLNYLNKIEVNTNRNNKRIRELKNEKDDILFQTNIIFNYNEKEKLSSNNNIIKSNNNNKKQLKPIETKNNLGLTNNNFKDFYHNNLTNSNNNRCKSFYHQQIQKVKNIEILKNSNVKNNFHNNLSRINLPKKEYSIKEENVELIIKKKEDKINVFNKENKRQAEQLQKKDMELKQKNEEINKLKEALLKMEEEKRKAIDEEKKKEEFNKKCEEERRKIFEMERKKNLELEKREKTVEEKLKKMEQEIKKKFKEDRNKIIKEEIRKMVENDKIYKEFILEVERERKKEAKRKIQEKEVRRKRYEEIKRRLRNKNDLKNILNELESFKIEDINKLGEENKSCVICQEDFTNNIKAIYLSCFHLFHKLCIYDWISRGNKICPVCKNEIIIK